MIKSLDVLCDDICNIAKEHGWDDKISLPLSPEQKLAMHMLFVREISEATESVRGNEDSVWFDESGKPEGEAIELADTVIRIAHYFGLRGWDLQGAIETKCEYNRTRPYRHGNKAI